jgi:hypothetical protein
MAQPKRLQAPVILGPEEDNRQARRPRDGAQPKIYY